MVDRRRGSENVAARRRAAGPAAMAQDPAMMGRNLVDELGGGDAEIRRGRVVSSIAQFGWHQVVLDNMGGIFSAEPMGRADYWGAQQVHTYQAGTQVLCAVNRQSNSCVVIGQIPESLSDSGDQYVYPSHLGTKAVLSDNPAASTFLTAVAQNDPTLGFAINPLLDQIAGDWGCQTSTGVHLLVDAWGISLTTDEVTGLSLDMLSQAFDLSGRIGVIETDGYRLASARPSSCVAELALGEAFLTRQLEPAVDLDAALSGENATRYDAVNMQRPLTTIVVDMGETRWADEYADLDGFPPWVMQSLDYADVYKGPSGRGARPTSWVNTLRQVSVSGELTLLAGRLFSAETIGENYQPTESEVSDHNRIAGGLAKFFNMEDKTFRMLSGVHTPAAGVFYAFGQTQDYRYLIKNGENFNPQEFMFSDRLRSGALLENSTERDQQAIQKAVLDSETVQISSAALPDIKLGFDRETIRGEDGQTARRDLLQLISIDENTGDISLINEHGAGIRISGNSVFIEGGNIRLAGYKDIRLVARDVELMANRNVTLSADHAARLYSAGNVSILSGTSGTGGLLLENRGTSQYTILPADAEKAEYTGITLKSLTNPVTVLGGDILLRAGDSRAGVAGRLVALSDGGDALISSRSRVILHAVSARLDTFGPNPFEPTGANVFSQYQSAISGTFSAGQIWSQGSIVARNDVQAVTGRVADAYGQGVGKVLQTSQILQSLQTLESSRSGQLQGWRSQASELNTELKGSGRILNTTVAAQISSGYVKAELAAQHYGSDRVADTIHHMYREAMGLSLKPFRLSAVDYKPGTDQASRTYGFPGKAEHKIKCVAKSPLIIQQLQSAEWDENLSKLEDVSFETVFGTIDDTDAQ